MGCTLAQPGKYDWTVRVHHVATMQPYVRLLWPRVIVIIRPHHSTSWMQSIATDGVPWLVGLSVLRINLHWMMVCMLSVVLWRLCICLAVSLISQALRCCSNEVPWEVFQQWNGRWNKHVCWCSWPVITCCHSSQYRRMLLNCLHLERFAGCCNILGTVWQEYH